MAPAKASASLNYIEISVEVLLQTTRSIYGALKMIDRFLKRHATGQKSNTVRLVRLRWNAVHSAADLCGIFNLGRGWGSFVLVNVGCGFFNGFFRVGIFEICRVKRLLGKIVSFCMVVLEWCDFSIEMLLIMLYFWGYG